MVVSSRIGGAGVHPAVAVAVHEAAQGMPTQLRSSPTHRRGSSSNTRLVSSAYRRVINPKVRS
jgi:hypothetical protein